MNSFLKGILYYLNLAFKTIVITLSIFGSFIIAGITFLILGAILSFVFKPTTTTDKIDIGDNQLKFYSGKSLSKNKIARLSLSGTVVDPYQEDGNPFTFISKTINGYKVKEQLIALSKEKSIKAVILDVNTYGGSPDSAKLILEGVDIYKSKTGNPIISYIDSAATSAGAMLTSNSSKIYASPSSIIANVGVAGSIRVKFNNPTTLNQTGLGVETKDGIIASQIYAGKFKRDANPLNPTDEEIQEVGLSQKLTNQYYDQFVDIMVKNRGIDANYLKNDLGARAIFAKDGLATKFVDQLGTREEAYDAMAKEAKFEDYAVYDVNTKSTGLAALLESNFGNFINQNKQLEGKFNFCYSDKPLLHLEPKSELCK
jgi:protease IV